MDTLSKLANRLLRNSAKKEADSSSSHPERGCQTAEAAETTSNLIIDRPRAKTAAFVALALVTVSAHQVLIIMTAAKSPHHSYRDPSTANKLLEEDRGSRTTQPQELGYHYLRRSLGQKPPGFQQDFTGFHMAHCITDLQSLLAGHDKGFRTTTVQNNTLLFTAASLASPQCRRSKGEDCPKRGKHTLRQVLAVVLRAHLCHVTSIFLPSTAIMGCFRAGWRKEDCSKRRKMKTRWRTSVRTALQVNF